MKITVSIFLIFLSMSILAQEELLPINYFGIGIGYRFDQIKDTNFSPLNQKGNSVFYSVFYERRTKNIFKVNVKYGNDILKSGRSDRLESSYYNGSIGITFLKNLSADHRPTNLYIGGSYSLDISYLDWNDQDAFSYFSLNGLSINAAVSKQLGTRQSIESSVSIPIIQFLSRPPYNGLDEFIIENQDDPLKIIFHGKLASLKRYKSINWNVNYRNEISSRFNWKVDYDVHIQKVESAHTFASLSNRVSSSILYNF